MSQAKLPHASTLKKVVNAVKVSHGGTTEEGNCSYLIQLSHRVSGNQHQTIDNIFGYPFETRLELITVTSWWARWRLKSPCFHLMTSPCFVLLVAYTGALCSVGYAYQTHLNLKSREISFVHNIHFSYHYNDVIMTTIASQITSLAVVYSTVYSDADQRKHQSSASLAFVWGIHRDRWIPRTKGQLRGKCFHLMTSSWHWGIQAMNAIFFKSSCNIIDNFMEWNLTDSGEILETLILTRWFNLVYISWRLASLLQNIRVKVSVTVYAYSITMTS